MKKLLEHLLIAVVSLVLAVGAWAAENPPVRTLPEVERGSVAATQALCGSRPVLVVDLLVEGREYRLLLTRERFILFDLADGDETPVWVGVVEQDRLAPRRTLTWAGLVKAHPSVPGAFDGCAVLYPAPSF